MPHRDDVRYNDHLTKVVLFGLERGRCYVCGRTATDVAHIVSRTAVVTRWDTSAEGNCHLLCRECHENDHAYPKASKYKAEFVRKNGQGAMDVLVARARQKAPLGFAEGMGRALSDAAAGGRMMCQED